jgi:low affinity Fe/Cu permease
MQVVVAYVGLIIWGIINPSIYDGLLGGLREFTELFYYGAIGSLIIGIIMTLILYKKYIDTKTMSSKIDYSIYGTSTSLLVLELVKIMLDQFQS